MLALMNESVNQFRMKDLMEKKNILNSSAVSLFTCSVNMQLSLDISPSTYVILTVHSIASETLVRFVLNFTR